LDASRAVLRGDWNRGRQRQEQRRLHGVHDRWRTCASIRW
jgi:hypothetical protein